MRCDVYKIFLISTVFITLGFVQTAHCNSLGSDDQTYTDFASESVPDADPQSVLYYAHIENLGSWRQTYHMKLLQDCYKRVGGCSDVGSAIQSLKQFEDDVIGSDDLDFSDFNKDLVLAKFDQAIADGNSDITKRIGRDAIIVGEAIGLGTPEASLGAIIDGVDVAADAFENHGRKKLKDLVIKVLDDMEQVSPQTVRDHFFTLARNPAFLNDVDKVFESKVHVKTKDDISTLVNSNKGLKSQLDLSLLLSLMEKKIDNDKEKNLAIEKSIKSFASMFKKIEAAQLKSETVKKMQLEHQSNIANLKAGQKLTFLVLNKINPKFARNFDQVTSHGIFIGDNIAKLANSALMGAGETLLTCSVNIVAGVFSIADFFAKQGQPSEMQLLMNHMNEMFTELQREIQEIRTQLNEIHKDIRENFYHLSQQLTTSIEELKEEQYKIITKLSDIDDNLKEFQEYYDKDKLDKNKKERQDIDLQLTEITDTYIGRLNCQDKACDFTQHELASVLAKLKGLAQIKSSSNTYLFEPDSVYGKYLDHSERSMDHYSHLKQALDIAHHHGALTYFSLKEAQNIGLWSDASNLYGLMFLEFPTKVGSMTPLEVDTFLNKDIRSLIQSGASLKQLVKDFFYKTDPITNEKIAPSRDLFNKLYQGYLETLAHVKEEIDALKAKYAHDSPELGSSGILPWNSIDNQDLILEKAKPEFFMAGERISARKEIETFFSSIIPKIFLTANAFDKKAWNLKVIFSKPWHNNLDMYCTSKSMGPDIVFDVHADLFVTITIVLEEPEGTIQLAKFTVQTPHKLDIGKIQASMSNNISQVSWTSDAPSASSLLYKWLTESPQEVIDLIMTNLKTPATQWDQIMRTRGEEDQKKPIGNCEGFYFPYFTPSFGKERDALNKALSVTHSSEIIKYDQQPISLLNPLNADNTNFIQLSIPDLATIVSKEKSLASYIQSLESNLKNRLFLKHVEIIESVASNIGYISSNALRLSQYKEAFETFIALGLDRAYKNDEFLKAFFDEHFVLSLLDHKTIYRILLQAPNYSPEEVDVQITHLVEFGKKNLDLLSTYLFGTETSPGLLAQRLNEDNTPSDLSAALATLEKAKELLGQKLAQKTVPPSVQSNDHKTDRSLLSKIGDWITFWN